MSIFERIRSEEMDHRNATYSNFKYIIECGDVVTLKTNSLTHAIEEAQDLATMMTASIFVNADKVGFCHYATFHYVQPYSVMDEIVVALLNKK